jgi:OOP family OmpA-OmpF porin
MTLSQARAEAVRSYLVSKGLPSDKISAVGKGKANPVAPNDTADGRANNRRVEIVVAGGSANAISNGK